MSDVRVTITDSSNPDVVATTWRTDSDGTHHTVGNLTFDRVSIINMMRCQRWHKDAESDWTIADWGVALVGEVGEAFNILKKLRRVESGTNNQGDPPVDELRKMLADELADVYLYLDLFAQMAQVDLPEAVVNKFNRTSEKYSFPERLP